MKVNFSNAYCRWTIPERTPGEERKPDELHVQPKNFTVRDKLRNMMGDVVTSRGHSVTRYRVEREVDGTFILITAKGLPR